MTFGELDRDLIPVMKGPVTDAAGPPIGCEIVIGLLREEMGAINPLKIKAAKGLLALLKEKEQERFWQLVLEDESLWRYIETMKS